MGCSDCKEVDFEGKWYAHPPMKNALIGGAFAVTAFTLNRLGLIPQFLEIALYLISIFFAGRHWIREGLEELFKEKQVGIEILMMAAAIGSAFLGMWDEAAFLVFLYGAAEGLEEYTYAKTRNSIRKLLDLAPKEARLLKNNQETMIPAQDLKPGDVFLVKPGESIATDGLIVKGFSTINEAPVTGESMPVEKKEGMKVFAATMNHEGVLEVKVTASFKDNTLSKMIHMVEEAQEQKGKTLAFIEKFGRVYSPLILLGSVLLIAIPSLLGYSMALWAKKAVVFLVAASPCALIMSTPVATAAGIGKAGRSGILIKGATHLEMLGKLKVIAFDKTGTLTAGKPAVTDIIPYIGSEDAVLRLAYSVDKLSDHPLAQSISKKAEEKGLKAYEAKNFSSVTGYGAKADVEDRSIYVGKPGLFKEVLLNESISSHVERLKSEGRTIVLVGTEDKIHGIIALRDEIRKDAKDAIQKLHSLGIKLAMLTGDNAGTANAIGKELGIDEVFADLKPEDKVRLIKELQSRHKIVAMVGDGVNDAPALAQADLGIAMGVAGSDAAIETADVALMADDLMKLPYALALGKKARQISLQNIVFSIAILIVLIPSALIGLMSVTFAVVVHEASEILAVINGLRVQKVSQV